MIYKHFFQRMSYLLIVTILMQLLQFFSIFFLLSFLFTFKQATNNVQLILIIKILNRKSDGYQILQTAHNNPTVQ